MNSATANHFCKRSIEPDTQNGLRHPSVALVFQLTAVDKNFVGTHIGRISDDKLKEIWSAFDELTGRA
jgi:mRNA-degrading endonuclease toxin of MazEF toxin-antitoxin module